MSYGLNQHRESQRGCEEQSQRRFIIGISSTDHASPRPQSFQSHLEFQPTNYTKCPGQRCFVGQGIGPQGKPSHNNTLLQPLQKTLQWRKRWLAVSGWPSLKALRMRLVRRRGLEPLCLAALAPQASASHWLSSMNINKGDVVRLEIAIRYRTRVSQTINVDLGPLESLLRCTESSPSGAWFRVRCALDSESSRRKTAPRPAQSRRPAPSSG